jgi:hypothetical protein
MSDNTSTLVAETSNQDILAAIQENGYNIAHVDKTPERCLAAVRQNGFALRVIPEALHTADMCIEAVRQNGRAIEYVSKKVLSYDICLEAVRIYKVTV